MTGRTAHGHLAASARPDMSVVAHHLGDDLHGAGVRLDLAGLDAGADPRRSDGGPRRRPLNGTKARWHTGVSRDDAV
ncbi:hypothetical protein [Streptosporangium sp. NPDC051022]|uniref:hypothetical protein n=1 Tax=Streptosporangium sp. NPDC051022 TaxID=3155752 RepID=UPI0034471AE1